MGSKLTYGLVAISAAGLMAVGVVAKDRKIEGSAPKIFTDVTACRAIADDAQRLACYDRSVGALSTAAEAKDVLVVDRETARKTKRGLFGLSLDQIQHFIVHQANLRILEQIRRRLQIPPEKLPVTLTRYGNTSSSALPIALPTRSNITASRKRVSGCRARKASTSVLDDCGMRVGLLAAGTAGAG